MTTIKKGETVKVLSGEDKGKKGKVVRVFPKKGMALVEGVNIKKRHQGTRQPGKKGQIVEKALPVRLSKLALVNEKK
jgi:large subunit ribosomal protein L24